MIQLAAVPWLTAYVTTVAAVQVVLLAVIAAYVARRPPPPSSPSDPNEISVRHVVSAPPPVVRLPERRQDPPEAA